MSITYREYRHEVNLIAEDAYNKALETHPEDRHERDDLMYDLVSESVGSHMWVIYYHYNLQVFMHTDNEDAYQDIYGEEDLGSVLFGHGLNGLHNVLARYAMEADVNQAIDNL